jgi:hypothetical protein
MMEKAPLQTYYAALVFSPSESSMMRQFWDQRYPRIKGAVHIGKARNLSALQNTLGSFGLSLLGRLLAGR